MSIRIALSESGAARADLDTELALPGDSRTVTVLADYLDNGKRFNVRDYGATGDGTTDDATAITAALAKAVTTPFGRLYFPRGTYLVNTAIALGSTPVIIEGDGMTVSTIKAGATMTAVFLFSDASANARFDFRNLCVNGNSLADYGIKSDTISHTTYYRVRAMSTLVAGFRSGFGWDNDFISCEASFNIGDGWYLSVSDANAVNLIGCKAFQNSGLGVRIKSGHLVNIIGGTIESNAKCGIYSATGTTLNVLNTYFEGNAADGLTFTTPAKTIQADIIINGSGAEDTLAHAFPHRAVRVEGCYTQATNLDQFIWTGGTEALSVVGNGCGATAVPLIGLYGDTTKAQAPVTLTDRNNRGFSSVVTVDTPTDSRPITVSGWDSDQVVARNYITDDPLQYSIQVSSNGGSVARGSTSFNGSETFVLTGATSTDIFGISLDLANYPELQGQLVTLSVWTKASVTTTGPTLYISALGSTTASSATSTDWTLTEFAAVLPTTGTVKFGFRKIAGLSTDTVTFSRPVLTVAGVPRSAFYQTLAPPVHRASAAPTTGTWVVGDVVWNISPSVAEPSGWICTTAGTPGTWSEFGWAGTLSSGVVTPAAIFDAGNSSTAITLTYTTAHQKQKVTLTGNATITLASIPTGGVLRVYLYTGAGSFTVTWAATSMGSVKWFGGTAPTITTTASKVDVFEFTYDGSNVIAEVVGQNA